MYDAQGKKIINHDLNEIAEEFLRFAGNKH